MLTHIINQFTESGKNPHTKIGSYQELSPLRASYKGIKLTSHLHPVPWVRMSGSTPPICHMPSWYEQGQFYFYFAVPYFTLLLPKKIGIIIGQHNQNQYTITVMAEFFHPECKQNVKIYSECQILQVVVCFLIFYSSKKYLKHPHEHQNKTVLVSMSLLHSQ
jgi:hypothetical protein